MITYPTIFFGAGQGPLREDFDDYPVGEVSGYAQIWQHHKHHWLVPRNPNKYAGITWKDYGVSGAYDDFDLYSVGTVSLSNVENLNGVGNFEIEPWSGFSAGFFRDSRGQFTSADQLRGYSYINFDWGSQPPINAYKSDFWSAKFIGKLLLPYAGTYQLYIERDDACRVYIGREDGPNTLIFNGWGTTSPGTMEPCTPFTFSKAGEIDILIHFYEDTANSKLKLYWSTPTSGGGGPTTPPVIILPSDFGNSGYVRVFSPQGPFESQGQTHLDFEGAYRLGVIKADPAREDIVIHNLDFSGSYRLGISYADPVREYSRTNINPQGYYVVKNQLVDGIDQSRNSINEHGFYAYRAAFATAAEEASNTLRVGDGYYVYKSVDTYNREYSRTSLTHAGFYDVGRLTVDKAREDFATTTIDPQGFYKPLYVPAAWDDSAVNVADLAGNYFPLYVYTREQEPASNFIYPQGYHFTGYINTDRNVDIARNRLNAAGHHAYYLVTTDALRETHTGKNLVGIEYGLYLPRYVPTRDAEPARNTINQHGVYFPRYLNTRETDYAFNSIDSEGIYYNIYAYTTPEDQALNMIVPNGYHITGFVNSDSRDYSRNIINPAGHYVSGYEQRFWEDNARNTLNPAGNYFFGIQTFYGADHAQNMVGAFGEYRGIYVYNRYAEFAQTTLSPQGEYYSNRKPIHLEDRAFDRIRFDGEYFIRFFPVDGGDDQACNTINPVGRYLTGYIYPYGTDVSRVNLDAAGNYFHRFVSGNFVDAVKNEQDLYGDYFYRFLYADAEDQGQERININGSYYARFLLNNEKEPAYNLLNPLGHYYSKYSPVREAEPAITTLGFADGLYYNLRPAWLWEDQANHFVTFDGELTYRFVATRDAEPAYNLLGFSEASYFTRFVTTRDTVHAKNLLLLAGEYFRESWLSDDSTVLEIDFGSEIVSFHEVQELAAISAEFSGSFTLAKVSTTLDYWLEIYQRPTYNMGKTQAYFSI